LLVVVHEKREEGRSTLEIARTQVNLRRGLLRETQMGKTSPLGDFPWRFHNRRVRESDGFPYPRRAVSTRGIVRT
jgi:hypothetical protein